MTDVLSEIRRCRGVLDAVEARLTTRLAELHAAGAAAPPSDAHTACGGVSSKEALAKERRAKALDDAPSLADKLASGEATAAHADALANAAGRLDEATRSALFEHQELLADDAARRTPEDFARNCRDLIRSIERDQGIDRDRRQRRETRLTKKIDGDGMYVLNARLHPELGVAVFRSLDAETAKLVATGDDRSADRCVLAAEALGNLVTGGHQAARPREAEISLLVDERTLLDGPHDASVCEFGDGTPVPAASVRRLVCNGHIVPVIVGADGNVLDVGRSQRLANRAQRRALRAMYSTCAFHGCDVPFERCEIHHILPFEIGGLTDLANLLPVCSRHHHLIHDQQWSLHLDRHRTLTVRDRTGAVRQVVPLPSSPEARRTRGPSPGSRPPRTSTPSLPSDSGRPPDERLPLIAS